MKKILLILVLFLSVKSFSQDSIKIQVSVQARDIEGMAAVASNEYDEDFFDAVKAKFRVSNPPTGTTTVVIDSMYIIDWLRLFNKVKENAQLIKSNTVSRVGTIIRAVGNTYLNGKLDAIDVLDTDTFQTLRGVGRFKLKKKN